MISSTSEAIAPRSRRAVTQASISGSADGPRKHAACTGAGQGYYVGSHGPIKILPDVAARIADVPLRRMRIVDPPVLMALPDAGTASLWAVAS